MKTKHEKLITSLLALGLVGVSPVGAQSANSFNSTFFNNNGLVSSVTINEDTNGDGNLDNQGADNDIDGDGVLETLYDETNIVEVGAGANGADLDINGDGVIQQVAYAQDLDNDGFVDLGNEVDNDGDGIIDVGGEDVIGGDGFLTLGEDTDADGNLDVVEDLDNDNNLDIGETDIDGDGKFDLIDETNIVEQGAGPVVNGVATDLDINGDGVIQVAAYAQDLDNDGFVDLGNEVDVDGDGVIDTTEDLNGDGNFDVAVDVDIDGDGRFDVIDETNIVEQGAGANGADLDINGDGVIQVAAYAQDLDNDGFVDLGNEVDNDGDGNFDLFLEDLDGDLNFDNVNEDVDGDGNLDLFAEDINRNGTLDTASRSYLTAVDPLTDAIQDLDIIVANDLLVNGEAVATENYADAQDDVVRAEFAAEDANIRGEFAAEDANIRGEFAAADAILQGQITSNANSIANNRADIDRNARGIAMVAALQHTTVLPGMTQALDVSAAHFEGETGLAINYARRINENVQINFGAASTSDFDESVIKAGIGWQW